LCCFSMNNTKGKHIFRYRLSPETFGYTLVCCTTSQGVERVGFLHGVLLDGSARLILLDR